MSLETQYARLRKEHHSMRSDVAFPESCEDDLDLCRRQFGGRCSLFRALPGLAGAVEANRIREDISRLTTLMVLRRYFDAAELLNLIEAKIPGYRSFLSDLRAAITRLSPALQGQWYATQHRNLHKITSDFETWYVALKLRYTTALPLSALDGPLPETPYQPVKLDEEFGEGYLKRGDFETHFVSLWAVAARMENTVDLRRIGEWADELFKKGLMLVDKIGRRLGELDVAVTAIDEAFRRPHLATKLPNPSPIKGSAGKGNERTKFPAWSWRQEPKATVERSQETMSVGTGLVKPLESPKRPRLEFPAYKKEKAKCYPFGQPDILTRYANLATAEAQVNDHKLQEGPSRRNTKQRIPIKTGDIDSEDSRFSWYSAFEELSDGSLSEVSDGRYPIAELRKAETDLRNRRLCYRK